MDIIGRALDDILLLETEMGEQGFLDVILSNSCWQEDRLLQRGFLNRVEPQGFRGKRVTPGRATREPPRVYHNGLEIGALLENNS